MPTVAAKPSELALLFLRLGLTSFGGPAAHIALIEGEVVRRRGWIAPERFLDLLGASNLIPGPSSTELAMFVGYELAGWRGLLLAGSCFILPAALLVGALAWAYVRFGSLPQLAGVLHGVEPVVLAVVAQALWRLGPKAIKKRAWLAVVGIGACVAFALGVQAVVVLAGAGVTTLAVRELARDDGRSARALVPLPLLFLSFLKVGALVFGSGYVLLAFLRADLVDRLHWLTEAQLLDAVAIGQVTPGPVFTTATFIGYLLAGRWGAIAATVAIFLPGFVLVAVVRPFVARARGSPALGAFLDGVNVAALALIAVVMVQLARGVLVDLASLAIAAAGAVLLIGLRINATWVVAGSALVGVLLRAAG